MERGANLFQLFRNKGLSSYKDWPFKNYLVFLFEKLDVYKKAIEFIEQIYLLSRKMNDREIKSQIKRAALSIPLNIAEGNGRNTPKEKRQFYKMARGSLFECVSLLEISLKVG